MKFKGISKSLPLLDKLMPFSVATFMRILLMLDVIQVYGPTYIYILLNMYLLFGIPAHTIRNIKICSKLLFQWSKTCSVTTMLNRLNLPSLQKWRFHNKSIMI